MSDGEFLAIASQPVSAGSSELGDCFYIESEDRCNGLKVMGWPATRNSTVTVKGVLSTKCGERVLNATSVTTDSAVRTIQPLGVNGTGLASDGITVTGLLVKLWGRVTAIDPSPSPRWFALDDGAGTVKCVAPGSVTINPDWKYLLVTGVASVEESGEVTSRVIRARSSTDIMVLVSE